MFVPKDIWQFKIKTGFKGKPTKIKTESYFFDVEKCKYCPKKEGCYKENSKTKSYTVVIKSDVHTKQMDYMQTDEFKELYAHRYKIEAKNSELKSRYGYDKASACGKNGVTIQGASAVFLSNMKRIFKLMEQN